MIIGHPGHELRVHHWLETAKPQVVVITDGSGLNCQPRTASTLKVFQSAGATPGPVVGRFTDTALYELMLSKETAVAVNLMQEVADWLTAGEFEVVAGDALEGTESSHDFTRYLIGAACERVRRQTGRHIANYDFLLDGSPAECPAELRASAICLRLDDAALERKLAAAYGYRELQQEVEYALKQFGKTMFATEWLRPIANEMGMNPATSAVPYYETYGEKQKAAGRFHHVIRYREHILPLAQAMWRAAVS